MMRLKLLHRRAASLIMTEACGTTSRKMMKVGGASSHIIKVCGATKSNSSNYPQYACTRGL